MPTLRIQFCLLLLQLTSHVNSQLSDLRRCADPQCQKVIAEAHTTMKYPSGHDGVLSFPNNAVAKIYSKEAGSNLDWWGVEINGKRGYAPKKFLREDRVLVPDKLLQHVVPVDRNSLLSANAKNENAINEKIGQIDIRTIENLTSDDDDEEEADGGEEFHDDGDDEEEGLEGFQLYNADANSPSNREQEQPTEKAGTAQSPETEAKPKEHSTTTEGITPGISAMDASAHISPSSVDFEVVDGTTIFDDSVDATPTPPAYLPEFETPSPMHVSATNAGHATTATPPLLPSVQTVAPLSEVGVSDSTTPELHVGPSVLPLSSLDSREPPATAIQTPALAEGAATSASHAGSSVVSPVDEISSKTENYGPVASTDGSNPETFNVDNGSTDTTSKDEVVDETKIKPDENNFHTLNDSDLQLSSAGLGFEVNDPVVTASDGGEETNLPQAGEGGPTVEHNFVPLSPVFELDSSPDVELNTDHIMEKVLHDSDGSIAKGNAIHDRSVDGGASESTNVALQSDDHASNAEGIAPESGDGSFDVANEAVGGLFDGWLSGWSSAEDDGDADVEASQESLKGDSSQSSSGETSELNDVANSGDGVVADAPSSVGEVSFISAADHVTASEHGSSFDATTEEVATTVTEAMAVAGTNEDSEAVQQNAGPSDDGGAVSGSETTSDSITAGDPQLVVDGGPLGDVVSSSPIPELRDLDLDSGKEELDTHTAQTENPSAATDGSEPGTGTSEPLADVSELLITDSEHTTEDPGPFTEASEPLADASEPLADASEPLADASEPITDASVSVNSASELADPLVSPRDDPVLGSSMAEPVSISNSADQLPPEEMVSSSAEQPADISDAMTDSSGDISGEALVGGDGAIPAAELDAPGTLTLDPVGDSSDLHDPESLTGHLLKTVEPIIQFMTGSSQLGESLSLALEHDLSSPLAASGALAAMVILALTILLLYVASALITKCSREGPLLKALNVLEHEQHASEQLIADLHHKLSTSHSQSVDLAGTVDSAEAARMLAQMQQVQEENIALTERVQDLEQQLEESTSSGLEMDNMLQELLHSQKDTASFQEAIDSLQLMLDSQREKVESLTADLSIKTTLNEELRGESASAKERIRKLEYQLDQVTQSLEEVNSAKAQVVAQLAAEQGRLQQVTEARDALAQSSSETSTALVALTEQHSSTQGKAQQLRSMLKIKEAELQVTKECLKQLKVFNDGKAAKEKLAQLLDSVKVRAELACAVEERRSLETDLQQRAEQAAQLERRVQQVKQEAEQCRSDQAAADHEKREALSKLAVLTNYFHEKEAQLTKELESESGLRLDAEGSAESITSRIRDYDMQLLAYKTQVNTLKKELEDQELSFKTQLAAQEQKAHESWVSARAAERKYEESKQETAQMRSRLLLMSKDKSEQHAIIKPTPQHAETSNGSVSSPRPPLHDDLDGEHSHPLDSPPPIPPPHMLPHLFPPPPNLPPGMPPPFPPPHFLPPPLPPPMMADRRLPPAGRLASPPFHRRMGAASPPEFLDRRSPPHFDRRSYSPASERSRYSDRQGRYSPDRHGRYSPDRHGRYSPDRQGRYSPDRHGRYSPDRQRRYSPDRHSDRLYERHHHNDRYNNIDRHSDAYSSNGRNDSQRDSSPERPYNRSPEGFARKASPPPLHRRLYDEGGGPPTRKGKKTSTPLGPNDR